jgi:DMSO/TMAO reductase YedYZ molybdopterin-dependent catalytic subunit
MPGDTLVGELKPEQGCQCFFFEGVEYTLLDFDFTAEGCGEAPSLSVEDPEGVPVELEATTKGISPLRTPTESFYRVDTALTIPRVDPTTWTLTIDGMVAQELTVTYDDILGMDLVERDITLNCVSNEVGGPYIGSARWTGVPVRALLERVGIDRGVDQILSTSVDGMNISTPVQALLDDREALLVVGMDGRPLPAKHGFPVRLLTPGLYGFVGATKWLERLTATTYAAKPAYWTERDWATDAPVRTQSRIDTPKGLGGLRAGQVAIGGVAWSQAHQGIRRVEVRVDDGPWVEATLGPEVGAAYWRQWSMSWEATPGRHQLTVRATDGEGTVQATERLDPFPSGAQGLHSIVVIVD